ncbi:MBL fold metallo-hydrolase [Phaeobacter gallaeciensis]|uniref:Zn-dependent hydrolase n=1 Tax=Phaeobacter gallaeciensis TaxID=60890 RepID=A0AAD0ECA8_9RHOB|nr:MBL fold metallo-hydrolase [Phaeobacter gallaeciensis]AHD08857.1 Zn-dependent hydrolase [Phaeobacter gallaeciensis DSM 26640]ATE92123.1 Zn-dependent hydrolase [Phaeobacter gallaeciensis]ATE98058.1 Zn-dependent hydrolase [Phaeobacter gallaeciensis]ATF00734.1 Zn-dependent hydrolase [Phaeobacter gallaeciensis]ATF05165.1 Zn-dependent hydrolase [Phaeobacter gallaeciensis]
MSHITRRKLLCTSLAGLAAALATPGFAVGSLDFDQGTLMALSDGSFTVPGQFWPGASEAEQAALGTKVKVGANVFLVRQNERIILIDAGAGGGDFVSSRFGDLGRLPTALADAGIAPTDVTDIVITHMHIDHSGGLIAGGTPAFENATIHIDQKEWDFWTDAGLPDKMPQDLRPMVVEVQQIADIVKDQVQPHDGTKDFGNGLRAIQTYGHTPGHNSFELDLEGEKLLIMGDLVVSDHIHFNNPDVGWALDGIPDMAIATRHAILSRAADEGLVIAGSHLTAPGLGRVVRTDKAYKFQPL